MDTAQRLEEVFAKKPGADELIERLNKLSEHDRLMTLYYICGSFQATTYETWATFHKHLSEAIAIQERVNAQVEADKAAAAQTSP